ncbi:MAG: tripartite tricarboxylate transporter substrate binding protein [Pseudorhodoplanes sp.]|jgi:tripartite-type tricarboxylate transporter receptor subunit TctC|nr:tripartite tricarboxylate transporter substrate binding protein [Pseudorhodoplanes sp.]
MKFAHRLAALVAAALVSQPVLAQDFPTRPIRFVVPAAAGGPTEITARLIADKMSATLGQPVVVEARPGGGGNIGADVVAKAAPDGYTILMATIGTHAINQTLYKKLTYDPLKDFTPVSQVVQYPLVLVVNPEVQARSVKELIDFAKANPGKLNRASGGNGTSMHLSGELFVHQAGVNMPHVPYKGSAPALNDLVGNHVQVMFDSLITALPLVQAGKLRALAVTGEKRSPVTPDLPTIREAGLKGYSAQGWIGVVAPANTPAPIVEKLHKAVAAALNDPEVKSKLTAQAAEIIASTPEEFANFIKSETAKWAQAVRGANLSID